MYPAICTGLAGVQLNPTNWNVNMAGVLHRSLLCLSLHCHATQLFNELLHESLVCHAVFVNVLHEFFVENGGICCSNIQEVNKEFPVPLHGFVLCCVILDQLSWETSHELLHTSHELVVFYHR